ncbi:MAG: hypothetical protein HYV60_05730 [Planctomycetia bacterium]|nr:hypothetical protein [Planctomycetia bacterium]
MIIAETFRGAGYQTYAVDKLHVHPSRARVECDDVILREEKRLQSGLTDDVGPGDPVADNWNRPPHEMPARMENRLIAELYGDDSAGLTDGRLTGLPEDSDTGSSDRTLSLQRGRHWPVPPQS